MFFFIIYVWLDKKYINVSLSKQILCKFVETNRKLTGTCENVSNKESWMEVIEINEQSIVYGLTIGGLVVTTILWISSRQKTLTPYINDIEILNDGSISIDWGYNNHTNKELFFEKGESCIHVKKGSALLLAKQPPSRFNTGKHDSVFRTIVTEGTVLEWIIGETRLEYSVAK